jgi:cytochrome c556
MNVRSFRPQVVVLLMGFAVAALVALGTYSAAARQDDDDGKRERLSTFMEVKLKLAQEVLAGLATEDYVKIAKNSRDISLLTQAESWQALQTPEYNQQSLEFRRAVDKITQAARDKDLDAATLAYVDVTMKCVNCHKYLRGVKFAQNDLDPSPFTHALAEK